MKYTYIYCTQNILNLQYSEGKQGDVMDPGATTSLAMSKFSEMVLEQVKNVLTSSMQQFGFM